MPALPDAGKFRRHVMTCAVMPTKLPRAEACKLQVRTGSIRLRHARSPGLRTFSWGPGPGVLDARTRIKAHFSRYDAGKQLPRIQRTREGGIEWNKLKKNVRQNTHNYRQPTPRDELPKAETGSFFRRQGPGPKPHDHRDRSLPTRAQ